MGGTRYIDTVIELYKPAKKKSNEEQSKEIIANIKHKLNLVGGG